MIFFSIMSLAFGEQIFDGRTMYGTLSESTSTEVLFSYVKSDSKSDLSILVTSFSDYSDPYIYFHSTPEVSESNYLYFNTSRNEALLKVPNLALNGTTYILLHCQNYCIYSLSVFQSEHIKLSQGLPLANTLEADKHLLFNYYVTDKSKFILISARYSGAMKMFVSKNNKDPGPANTMMVLNNWVDDYECFFTDFEANDVIYILIITEKRTEFSIVVVDNDEVPVKVQASKTIIGTIELFESKFYYIELNEHSSMLDISLTVFRGDADIFVSFNSQPNIKDYDFKSDSIGNDHIKLSKKDFEGFNFASGKVFITIHGNMDSKYSFVARTNLIATVELTEGVPQESFVSKNNIQYFYYKVSATSQNLFFYLTTYSGDTELYIRLCSNRCIINKNDFETNQVYKNNANSALKTIEIKYEGDNSCTNQGCNFVIAIFGKVSSYYSIVSVSESGKIHLQQGKSFIMSSPIAGKHLFEYVVTEESVYEVDFVVSPIYGDPDICTNLGLDVQESCEKKSEKTGIEVDQVIYQKGKDFDSLTGIYFIIIQCPAGCYYSIVPREQIPGKNTTIHLIPGHPQKDKLENIEGRDFRIYYFDVTLQEDIKILLAGHTGKFEILVSSDQGSMDWNNERFYYDWKAVSSQANANILTISKLDHKFKSNSTYLVLVQATAFATDDTATFTLQFIQGNQILMLTSDISLSGTIQGQEYSYYSFPIQHSNIDLKISLTVISGNPDLFISFDPTNIRPSKEKNDMRSTNLGSETLTLLWDEAISQYCPILSQEYQHGDVHSCYLYISVYSDYNSSYSLRVSPQSNLPQYLVRQETIHSTLNKGEYDFFYTYVDVTEEILIVLQNIIGESELLIKIEDKTMVSEDFSEWKRPNEDSTQIKMKNFLSEEILLKPEDLKKSCIKTCLILIGSLCQTHSCSFLLENSDSDVVKLVESQAKYGIVGREFKYYSYMCDKTDEVLIFTVTPMESCNPSMFISKGELARPTSSVFNWKSKSISGDSILIYPSDKNFTSGTMIGAYIIGITSEDEICNYTLIVTNHDLPVIILSPGIPQKGTIMPYEMKHYAVYNTIGQQVDITLTPITGNPFLFVSVHLDQETEFYSNLPTVDYSIWSTRYSNNKFSLQIKESDPNYCRNCYYIIGVLSEVDSSYMISATNEINIKVLQNGVPSKADIAPGDLHIYKFSANYHRNLYISVSEYSHVVDFNVSISKDTSGYIWRTNSGANTKSIVIETSDPNFIVGTYYVVVSCSEPETLYSIVWYDEESYISLVDGWPSMYGMDNKEIKDVRFKFYHDGSIFCMLESLTTGFYPTVVVYSKYNQGNSEIANYVEKNYTGDHLYMNLVIKNGDYLLFEVKNNRNKTAGWSEFSLYCTKSFHPGFLNLGRTAIGHLDKNIPALRYELSVQVKDLLSVYIIPCSGSVELKASTNWTIINDEQPLIVSSKLSDGIIFGSLSNVNGKVYLTVSKTSEGISVYKIIVERKHIRRLYPGDDGFISWDENKGKTLVKWNKLEFENGNVFNGDTAYRVFYTENENVELKSTCQAEYAASKGQGVWIGTTEEEEILLSLKKKGFINVVATVLKHENVALNNVIYDKTRIESNSQVRSYRKLLVLLSLLVIILLAGVAIYFFKYRQVKIEIKQHQDQGIKLEMDETIVNNRKEIE